MFYATSPFWLGNMKRNNFYWYSFDCNINIGAYLLNVYFHVMLFPVQIPLLGSVPVATKVVVMSL